MLATRIFTDADGVSRFADFDIPLSDRGDIGRLSAWAAATGIIFRETPGDYAYDWHPAPRRQFVLILDGMVEIEVGDGSVRRFGAGDILLVEDLVGRGHKSRAVDGKPRRSVFVTLD
jgi:hypothetical protein